MDIIESLIGLWHSTGLANFITTPASNVVGLEKYLQMFGMPIMIVVCFFLLYLGIKKQFEPLLLFPISFGGLLANILISNIAGDGGFLHIITFSLPRLSG